MSASRRAQIAALLVVVVALIVAGVVGAMWYTDTHYGWCQPDGTHCDHPGLPGPGLHGPEEYGNPDGPYWRTGKP